MRAHTVMPVRVKRSGEGTLARRQKKRARLSTSTSETEKRMMPIKAYEDEASGKDPSPIKFALHSSQVRGVAAQMEPSVALISPERAPAPVPRPCARVPVLRHGARGLRGDPIALQHRLVALLFVLDKVGLRLRAPARHRLALRGAAAGSEGALRAETKVLTSPRLSTVLLNCPSATWAIDALDGKSSSLLIGACVPADYILTAGQGARVFCATLLTTRCAHDSSNLIATGGAEGIIRVWSLGERREECEWRFPTERSAPVVMLVSIDGGVSTGEVLLAGYDSGDVELWSVEHRVRLAVITKADGQLSSARSMWTPTTTAEAMSCAGDERREAMLLLAGWDGNVKIFAARLGATAGATFVEEEPRCVLRSTFKARHTDTITCSLLIDDRGTGARLVTGGCDATLNVWTLPTPTSWGRFEAPPERDQIAYALTGHDAQVRCLLALGSSGLVPPSGEELAQERGPRGGTAACVRADICARVARGARSANYAHPVRIVSGACDSVLRVWLLGATSGDCVAEITGHDGPITAVVSLGTARREFAPSRTLRERTARGSTGSATGHTLLIASASADGTARIWRIEDDSTWECSCILNSLAGSNGLVALARLSTSDRMEGASRAFGCGGRLSASAGSASIDEAHGGELTHSESAESDKLTQSDDHATAACTDIHCTPLVRCSSGAGSSPSQSSSCGGASARSGARGLFSTQCFVMCGEHLAPQLGSPQPHDAALRCFADSTESALDCEMGDDECDFADEGARGTFPLRHAAHSIPCSSAPPRHYETTTMLRTQHMYDEGDYAPVRLLTAAMDGTLKVWNVSEALSSTRASLICRPIAKSAVPGAVHTTSPAAPPPHVVALDLVV